MAILVGVAAVMGLACAFRVRLAAFAAIAIAVAASAALAAGFGLLPGDHSALWSGFVATLAVQLGYVAGIFLRFAVPFGAGGGDERAPSTALSQR
ncbi:MAG: hypothetical protein ACRCWF_05875 [Beijerinckiaceae bacterium]